MEHRWGQRMELQTEVRLQVESLGTLPGRISNLSLSGVFVTMPIPPLPLWTRVAVYLDDAPRGRRTRQALFAYVVRRTEEGVGLEWCQFAPHAIRRLLSRSATRPSDSRRVPQRAATTPPVVATHAPTGR